MRVLVLGGYGAGGRHLVSMLRHDGHTAVAAGRDTGRADAVIDLDDPELDAYRATLPRVDVVVNASGAENSRLAALAGASDCAFIDISATAGYLDQLRQLPPLGPIIVDVGLAPGLTNLLAIAVHSQAPRPLVRLDFSDQHTLRRELNVPVRTFFGLDSRLATAALAALTWQAEHDQQGHHQRAGRRPHLGRHTCARHPEARSYSPTQSILSAHSPCRNSAASRPLAPAQLPRRRARDGCRRQPNTDHRAAT